MTPLGVAVEIGANVFVAILLSFGADARQKTLTLNGVKCFEYSKNAVGNSASHSMPDPRRRSPVDISKSSNHKCILLYLQYAIDTKHKKSRRYSDSNEADDVTSQYDTFPDASCDGKLPRTSGRCKLSKVNQRTSRIRQRQKSSLYSLQAACIIGNSVEFEKLIIDAFDVHGYAAIHYACITGKKGLVELLINAGVDVDAVGLVARKAEQHGGVAAVALAGGAE